MKNKTKQKFENIEIEAEFPMAVEELAFEIMVKGEKVTDMINILETEPQRANEAVKRMLEAEMKDKVLDVIVKNVCLDYIDSYNIIYAVSYFKVKLEGIEKDLKKVAGNEDKLFQYEWKNEN